MEHDRLIIGKSSLSDSFVHDTKLTFNTYDDHRIAMALAGLKLRFDGIDFDDYGVVSKSYPTFWSDVQKLCGF